MEKPEISEGLAETEVAATCAITVNDERTCDARDTSLTQLRSPGVHGWTYFIRVDDAIKIGFASNARKRIAGLQTSQQKEIEVLAIVPAYLVDEYKTHQLFAHLRIRGEWFRAEPDLLYFIEQAKIEVAANPAPEAAPLLAPRSARSVPVNNSLSEHEAIRRLINTRAKVYGADSPGGHTCSNLVEQLENMRTYVRPEWAQDVRQTLPWMIQQQMKRLAPRALQ